MIPGETAVKPPLLSIPFIKLITLNFTMFLIMFMQIGTFPEFILHLGGSSFHAGLSIGLFTGAAFLTRPLAGYLADRFNRKHILILGSILFAAALLPFLALSAIPHFLLLRFIGGTAFSIISTTSMAIVSSILPDTRLGEGIGYFSLTGVTATASGPAIGIFLADSFGYRSLFLILIGIGLLNLIIGLALPSQGINRNDKETAAVSESGSTKLKKSHFRPSLILLFSAVTLGVILTFVPMAGTARSITGISLFFTTYSIAIVIIRLSGARIIDTVSPAVIFTASAVLLIASFITLAFAFSLPLIILAGILFGFGWGLYQPLLNTLQFRFIPADRRGMASGAFNFSMDFGVTIGSVGFGILLEATSFTLLFISCSLLIVMSVILFYFLVQRQLNPA